MFFNKVVDAVKFSAPFILCLGVVALAEQCQDSGCINLPDKTLKGDQVGEYFAQLGHVICELAQLAMNMACKMDPASDDCTTANTAVQQCLQNNMG